MCLQYNSKSTLDSMLCQLINCVSNSKIGEYEINFAQIIENFKGIKNSAFYILAWQNLMYTKA